MPDPRPLRKRAERQLCSPTWPSSIGAHRPLGPRSSRLRDRDCEQCLAFVAASITRPVPGEFYRHATRGTASPIDLAGMESAAVERVKSKLERVLFAARVDQAT